MNYRLARGVRLKRDAGGEAMLLIPEGIVSLNDTAAAALELADGSRSVDSIAELLAHRFDAEPGVLRADVDELLRELESRGFVTC